MVKHMDDYLPPVDEMFASLQVTARRREKRSVRLETARAWGLVGAAVVIEALVVWNVLRWVV